MPDLVKFASTSNLVRFTLKDKSTGQGKTGLTGSTSGLIISTIADNESSATAYTQAASHIQTIATLGTYAAPSASNCRFGEVDATNHRGLYEFQFADARFAVSSSKRLVISVNDAGSTILDIDYEIELVQFDPFDAVRLGLTAMPNAAASASGGLLTFGTSTGQINPSSGKVPATIATGDDTDAASIKTTIGVAGAGLTAVTGVTLAANQHVIVDSGTVTTVTNQLTAAAIATGVWQDTTAGDFTAANSIGKSLFTSGVVPGAAGGLFIAGTNAATTITTSLTTHIVGTVDTVTTLTNLPAITTDWLTGTGVAASAVTKIQAGLATPTNITAGTITTATNLTNLPTAPTDWLTAAAVKADAVTKIQAGLSTYAGGAVASVSGNVGGNVAGTIGGFTAAALAQFFTLDSTKVYTDAIAGSVVKEIVSNAGGTPPSASQIATAVWSDVTPGDFTTVGSPGAILVSQLGGTFTTTSSSIFSTASLANAPTGGAAPTASQVATAVWQDATAGDFTTSGSIGKSLFTSGNAPGTSGGLPTIGTSPLPASGTLAKAVWDEINTGATHNLANSTGKQLRASGGSGASSVIYGPVTLPSQAGMTATQIKLDAGASLVSQVYRYNVISVISGTDAGDSAVIINYNGSTKVCDLDEPVAVQPDNTSVVEITPGAKALVIDKTGFSLAATGLDLLPAGSLDGKGDWLTSLGSTAPSNWITSAVIAAAALNGKGDWLTTTDARLNNLDRTISSRSTYAGGPVASVLAAVTLPGIPTGWITAAGIADGALDGKGDWSTLTAAQAADKIVGRNIEGGFDGGRTVGQALAFLRNRWRIEGDTLIVYAANDANTLWTATVSTATSNPITGIDPA